MTVVATTTAGACSFRSFGSGPGSGCFQFSAPSGYTGNVNCIVDIGGAAGGSSGSNSGGLGSRVITAMSFALGDTYQYVLGQMPVSANGGGAGGGGGSWILDVTPGNGGPSGAGYPWIIGAGGGGAGAQGPGADAQPRGAPAVIDPLHPPPTSVTPTDAFNYLAVGGNQTMAAVVDGICSGGGGAGYRTDGSNGANFGSSGQCGTGGLAPRLYTGGSAGSTSDTAGGFGGGGGGGNGGGGGGGGFFGGGAGTGAYTIQGSSQTSGQTGGAGGTSYINHFAEGYGENIKSNSGNGVLIFNPPV